EWDVAPAWSKHPPVVMGPGSALTVVRLSGTTWRELSLNMRSHSRGALRPSFGPDHPRRIRRGRREGRVPADTHGPRATRKHAAEPQVQPDTPGLPCAMVLRLIRDLPGEPGFLATVGRRTH